MGQVRGSLPYPFCEGLRYTRNGCEPYILQYITCLPLMMNDVRFSGGEGIANMISMPPGRHLKRKMFTAEHIIKLLEGKYKLN